MNQQNVYKSCIPISYISIYMYKENLALNNLQWLICPKVKPKLSSYGLS